MSLTLNDITKKTAQLIAEGDDDVVGSLLDLIYPIGSIYMNVNDTCPSLFLGGVWERIQDRFLLCSGSSYGSGTIGGSATKTLSVNNLPSHNHSVTDAGGYTHTRGTMNITGKGIQTRVMADSPYGEESGAICNRVNRGDMFGSGGIDSYSASFDASKSWTGETSSNGSHSHTIGSTGSGTAFDIMPPYLAVFVWKRVG